MSDLADIFGAYRQERIEKKRRNLEQSTQILRDRGVSFTAKNNGVHLIIRRGTVPLADFWPSTGKWIMRTGGKKGRGVFNLLNELGIK